MSPEDRRAVEELLRLERLRVRGILLELIDVLSTMMRTQASMASVVAAVKPDERYKAFEEYFSVQSRQFLEMQRFLEKLSQYGG